VANTSNTDEPKVPGSSESQGLVSRDNRRRLLKALAGTGTVFAAGGVVPAAWKQPVVNSIVLPAHASLTCGSVQSYSSGMVLNLSFGSLIDSIVPRAYAAEVGTMATAELCIQCNGNGRVNVRVLFESYGDGCLHILPYFERNDIPIGQTKSLNLINCVDDAEAQIIVESLNGTAKGQLNLLVHAGMDYPFVGEFSIGPGSCNLDPPDSCIDDSDC